MLGGVALSQLLITLAQVLLTFLTAVLIGMHNNGSYLLMVGITLLMSLTATGLGLICACIGRNDGEAANLATVFLLPLVFLSGTLFPMPDMTLLTIAGHTLSFQQLMPTAHATDAMRRVMFYGEGAAEVSPQLLWMAVLSLLIFILGAWLFQLLRLNRQA
jgi:ABC-2 type transport system permease protein